MTDRLTAIVSINGGAVKHYWYNTRDEAMREAVRMDREGGHGDLYWSMAEFNGRKRKRENAHQLQNFWLDLDCGEGKPYATKAEGFQAFIDAALPNPSLIVDSGNGLHIYWTLEAPVPVEDWQPVAEHLKRACVVKQLNADHAITADAARILRVPGTRNWKNGTGAPVRVLRKATVRYSLDGFRGHLPAVGPLREAPQAPIGDEWSVDANEYPPAHIENVLRGCKQMREAAKVQSSGIAEPYWRAVLSVAYRCEGGDQLIHKVSQGDARYNARETERKAQGTSGPATCSHFDSVNPTGCAGCPMSGAVKSPIAIPAPAPTPDAGSEDAPGRSNRIGDWHITAKGVYKMLEDEEGNHSKVWAVLAPVYGDTFRTKKGETETDDDDAKLTLTWLRPDGKWRRTLMPLNLVGSGTQMMQWAGAQGLATLIPSVKVWTMFISELTNHLLQEQQVTEYYARLGWHMDNEEFVLGTRRVTAEGTDDATIERNSPLSQLAPQGSIEDWKAGVEILNRKGLEKHQFCIMAGFGSPLLQLMDVAGAAVSLAGASGKGKTLAARTALSIYGDPDMLFQSADASKNSTDVHLSTLHSVPYLMDEITSLPDKRIGELLYMIANGRGKDTLQRSRAWADGGSWRLLAFLTTNSPIMEASQAHLTEAQRNRAIELIVDQAIPSEDAGKLYGAIARNHGVAAQPFMHYVIQHKDEIRKLTDACVEKVKAAFEGQDAQRFGVWALASALAGGLIAKKLGLIEYDPWHVITTVLPSLKEQSDDTKTPEQQFIEIAREYLTEYSNQVTDTVRGRVGYADDPIARVDHETLYIHSARFREALRARNVSLNVIKGFLRKHATTGIRARLAQNTPPVGVISMPKELIYGKEGTK